MKSNTEQNKKMNEIQQNNDLSEEIEAKTEIDE